MCTMCCQSWEEVQDAVLETAIAFSQLAGEPPLLSDEREDEGEEEKEISPPPDIREEDRQDYKRKDWEDYDTVWRIQLEKGHDLY